MNKTQNVDFTSLQNNMMRFAKIGMDPDGNINRTFGSMAYLKAAKEMEAYMQEAGMLSYIDAVGNVHGFYEADRHTKEEIIIGSHLDTVKNGGIFDGLLGIVAGVECVRKLRDSGARLSVRIHVIATNGEEGNILGGTFGSRAMLGLLDFQDSEFLEKASECGYRKKDLESALYDTKNCKLYLEMHIEQGRTLELEKKQIGLVTGIVGLQRYRISIEGKSNHAGTTMMEYRKDALVEAAKCIADVDERTRKIGKQLVTTFSQMEISPNVLAVINQSVKMVLECRNQSQDLMQEIVAYAEEKLENMENTKMSLLVKKEPVDCDMNLIDTMESICKEQEITYLKMPSGATHDGNSFAKKMPIGMIFVPSKDGISHSKEEYTAWEDIGVGMEVLYRTLHKISHKKGA